MEFIYISYFNFSFLHLIDYIIVIVMRDLLENTYSEFMTILQGHTNFLPSQDQLSNPGMDIVIEDPRANNSPYKVFIHVN